MRAGELKKSTCVGSLQLAQTMVAGEGEGSLNAISVNTVVPDFVTDAGTAKFRVLFQLLRRVLRLSEASTVIAASGERLTVVPPWRACNVPVICRVPLFLSKYTRTHVVFP